jgi:hypothetical protein
VVVGLSGCKKESAPSAATDNGGSAPAAAPPLTQGALALLAGFEGEIDLSMPESEQTPPKNTAMAILVKSGKVRFDVPEKLGARTPLGQGAYVILDAAAKKLEIVSDAKKQVFVVDFSKSGETLKGLGAPPRRAEREPAAQEPPKTTITKTGKTERVAGRKCEDWDVVSDHRQGTVCIAEEEASFFHIPLTGFPAQHAWAAEMLDGKHFPLRFIGYDRDGLTEKSRLEVTKLDKKSLDAGSFTYPPDYRVSDFGEMLAGLGGMPGGRPGMPEGARGVPAGMPSGMRGLPPEVLERIRAAQQMNQH